jgi:hypothetical protein
MKLSIAITVVLLTPCHLLAQDPAGIEKLMTKRAINCADILYNSSLLIPTYFHDGKIDSMRLVMKYWEDRCGLAEPLLRAKILLAIRDGNFEESLYEPIERRSTSSLVWALMVLTP